MSTTNKKFYTPNFSPIPLSGNASWSNLTQMGLSENMLAAVEFAPQSDCIFWGLSFSIAKHPVVIIEGEPAITCDLPAIKSQWLVFAHTSDFRSLKQKPGSFPVPNRGEGHLAEHAANYILIYSDGSEAWGAIRRRHQLGMFQRNWGENCVESVAHTKPQPVRGALDSSGSNWGINQPRVNAKDSHLWTNWLWAWENPHPDKSIVAIRFEALKGNIVIAGLSCGKASTNPIRWQPRKKALLKLPEKVDFDPRLNEEGLLSHLQLDMGVVISAMPRTIYPQTDWENSYNNQLPTISKQEILIEYTAHPDACFHLPDNEPIPVAALEKTGNSGVLKVVPPATQLVTLKAIEKSSQQPVPVKLHIHGEAGEYLAPVDRHRIPNPNWFEDYSADFSHKCIHVCTYIPGETRLKLPQGKIYLEISKGFEIRPIRKIFKITPETEEIVVEIEKVLPWWEQNWVSADTHVHFLSPQTGLLEGSAEGVNVVNLLASQWGELMTNVGDFDGKTVFGAKETGGNGEYLLRVGTENRQHVLGHISLIGYNGPIISPMCSGGPDEAALGDPVEILLTEWARQCKAQGGIVVIPHFPNPRMEHAATIIEGEADAVEMTSWDNLYAGINPYSLADWYRYLNNGYLVAAVGGTDKMSATTAVGTVRTYARISSNQDFSYETWKDAIRRTETFVTYGPLLDFSVDGHPIGSRFSMSQNGGTIDVSWKAASVTIPMSRIELIANGEIIESQSINSTQDSGNLVVKIKKSTWLAILIRGHYPDKTEIVAAHSSPVMIDVAGSEFYQAADALTILEQIEGAQAYLDTVGTRAETETYQRMKLLLTATHRKLHNRMHQQGVYHEHSVTRDHAGHGK